MRLVADGKAPGPTYAAIGVFDAVTPLSDPIRTLAVVATAWRDPVGRYGDLVERGWVRVVSNGAELAVRRKAPRLAGQLAPPARSAASTYVKGRSRMRSRSGRQTIR